MTRATPELSQVIEHLIESSVVPPDAVQPRKGATMLLHIMSAAPDRRLRGA